ncbi:MAG TPA: WD40 repeat domain-containing protein, partial [Candidatus Deferrimicrobium sp.]|nr:WD40 repeat domain-containing protein [Candidatus Deferrimicrobium sp.]
DNKELLIQLKKLMEQARGVQVVITSRYDMRGEYGCDQLHLLELAGLEEVQVRQYLEERKVELPGGRLAGLLRNPMMLTLYASTCEVEEKAKYQGDFKRQVETAGELLWNFMETQAVVLLERLNYDQKTWWFYKFLLKFMLPAMGYEMEKAGLFAFDRNAFYGVLDKYCLRFSRSDFFETFADYEEYEEAMQTGFCADDKARRKRRVEIVKVLCKVLFMVVKEGDTYRFLHQYFRDYFAALHILHEAEMGVKRGEVTEVLKERSFPDYIHRFMGEIEGEHYQRPVFQEGKGWLKKEDSTSLLNRVLDLCRGVFDGSVGFGPCNIVEVWKEVRGELSGAELSKLDLSRVELNSVHCSRFFRSYYLAARFDDSLLQKMSLFPRDHSNWVNSAVYSTDGKKILTASWDITIKEWDVKSGQCLKTFTGHTDCVNSAMYSADGKKILSASSDHTIKEWCVESGQCLKTFTGHNNSVNSVLYSVDGKKILSASDDCTIKEWDVESGRCLKTFTGHTSFVNNAMYSSNGKKILSASYDETIKEWDVENVHCLKEFIGHTNWVRNAVYSNDGEKILSASHDATIKVWDMESKLCLKTYTGHNSTVTSAIYSGDGKKILSASYDETIKIWDVESEQCLNTFNEHTDGVRSVVYSGDEKKILFASKDGTIKELEVENRQCLKTSNSTSSNLKSEKNPGCTSEKPYIYDNEIRMISHKRDPIRTFINIPGLLIQGCSFKNLPLDSDLSEDSKELLLQYGGKFE